MKKNKGIVLGALCLAMTLAAGCAQTIQQPSMSDAAQDEYNVRFLHIWSEHEETIEHIIHGIEEKNEGLHVEINSVGWENLSRELSTSMASDDMYDVFFTYASSISSQQKEGLLLELDSYVDDQWAQVFQDGALEEYRVDGALCGLPYRGSGVVVIYNKEMFQQRGWRVPRSQSELVALMQLIQNEDLVPLSAAGKPDGFQLNTLRGIVTNYIAQENGLLNDPERLTERKTDWQGELAVGAQTVKSWANKGYFGANPLTVDKKTAMNRFLSGKAAMLLCNTNELYELRRQTSYMPFDMGSFLIPGIKESGELLFSGACFQDGFAIWSGTDQPELSVALLKGLTGKENAGVFAEETLSVMAMKDVQCEDAILQEFNEYFAIAGRYRIAADYALGDSEDLKAQLFVDYMTSEMTADAYETNYETIIKDAIAAAER